MNFTAERTFEQALEIKKNEEKAERYRKQKEEKAERDRQQEQTNARLAAQATETWKASIQGMGQFGPISSDDGSALAFFTSPISRNGSKIRIWERDELEYQMLGYSSSYELTEIDCAINTHRTVQITTYGENNLLGAVLYTGRGKALSEYIAPNTIIDAISKSACKMHLSRKRHH